MLQGTFSLIVEAWHGNESTHSKGTKRHFMWLPAACLSQCSQINFLLLVIMTWVENILLAILECNNNYTPVEE